MKNILLFFFLFQSVFIFSQDYLVWGDFVGNEIRRINFDGTNSLQLATENTPRGIAIDENVQAIFYIDGSGKTLKMIGLTPGASTVIANFNDPVNLQLDTDNRFIYVTDNGAQEIVRLTYEGLDRQVLINTPGAPMDLFLDFANDKIYWNETSNNTFFHQANLDGSNPEKLFESGTRIFNFVLDSENDKIWIADRTLQSIVKTDLDGSNLETVINQADERVSQIKIDHQNDEIYWTEPTKNRIRIANIDGSGARTIVDDILGVSGIALAIDASPIISNNADINDPCACNLSGGLADGTFTETVTVADVTGETWTVVAITPLNGGGTNPTGIAITSPLVETPAASGNYEITFSHSNLDGYNLTVERASDNMQMMISNVCAVPEITLDPVINAVYLPTDPTVTLGANVTNGHVAAAGSPTFSLDDTNDITQLDFDPAVSDLTIGQVSIGSYTLTGHYETDGNGSGTGGTLVTPATPTNACPVEVTAAFDVGTPAAPVPTLGQWGLIILSLLLLNFGFVFLSAPKLAPTGGMEVSTFNFKNLPFDLNAYTKIWAATIVGILIIFTAAVQLFGYELTSTDPLGALVSSFLVAYAFFVLKNEN